MADTGAQWNIPYAEPSDLVRDWPALSEDVADAVADALDGVVAAGIGSNVVQAVKTDTFSNSFVVGSGIAQVEVTGLNVTITPSSTSSKVLVIATVSGSSSVRSGIIDVRLAKGGNAIGGALGNVSGTNRFALTHRQSAIGNNGGDIAEATIVYLDSPGVASATTYSIFCVSPDDSSTQTVYINRSNTDTDSFSFRRTISTITAIEVAA
jgi:hypothetical protein